MSVKTIEFEYALPNDGSVYRVVLKSDMDDQEAIKLMRAVLVGCLSVMPLIGEAMQQEDFDAMMRRLLNGDKGYE